MSDEIPQAPIAQEVKSPIDQANETLAKLEAANKRQEDLLKQQEEMYSKMLLSGKSVITQKEQINPQEKQKQELAGLYKGTMLERYFK
jgi:hypothetical protein